MNISDLTDTVDLEDDLNTKYFEKLSVLGLKSVFEVGQYVFHQGDDATSVYILTRGSLKTTRSIESGVDTLIKMHRSGSLVGLSALRPTAKRDANCIAVKNSEARRFGRDEFFGLLRADGELGILLLQLLLKRQQLLHSRVSDFTGLSVEQRLARVLVEMHLEKTASRPGSSGTVLQVSHEELAALVYSRRQYITEILGNFVKNGMIETGRQRIKVLEVDKLLSRISA